MKLQAELQFSGRHWWQDCSESFKTKILRDQYIKEMNAKYQNIKFRAKGERDGITEDLRFEEECTLLEGVDTTPETKLIMTNKTVIIYTDGSSNYRDKSGGIGVYLKFGEIEKIIQKGYSNTTNNRMELRAILEAMRAIKNKSYEVHIYSDSEYCINICTSWIYRWKEEQYAGKQNQDLLELILTELDLFPKGNLIFHWVKGHSGVEGNEIVDMLASEARKAPGEHPDCLKTK